jgi:hypothetical protein
LKHEVIPTSHTIYYALQLSHKSDVFQASHKNGAVFVKRFVRSGKRFVWSTHSAQDVHIRCLLFVHITSNAYLYDSISSYVTRVYALLFNRKYATI